MVEVPLRQPNWLGSMMSLTSSISHSTTKSSRTLDTTAVKAIGLKSPLPAMGVTLGTGVVLESFHAVGKVPADKEVLNITVMGSANSGAYSFQMRVGIASGPEALKGLMASSFLHTLRVCITGGLE